jgi:hypothetical protein
MASALWGIVVLVCLGVVLIKARRGRHTARTFTPGHAAMGAVYDLLNQDRRNAIEIIVEDKAEARDPEDADGNLPDLERPRRANTVSAPRERSEPAKRRARERVGEFEGQSPSNER